MKESNTVVSPVSSVDNRDSFWYAELAPVSKFAPAVVQAAEVSADEKYVIPMSTLPGSCTA